MLCLRHLMNQDKDYLSAELPRVVQDVEDLLV
jgi:hypothetical protein